MTGIVGRAAVLDREAQLRAQDGPVHLQAAVAAQGLPSSPTSKQPQLSTVKLSASSSVNPPQPFTSRIRIERAPISSGVVSNSRTANPCRRPTRMPDEMTSGIG